MNGYITHIQRNSIHDGPGIRTTVFMKGCNMHCAWCHNPESINCHPELMFYANKCIDCKGCKEYLTDTGHNLAENHSSLKELPKIKYTDNLKRICFTEALQPSATEIKVEELINKLLLDKPFYDKSGGGITISGGEPVLQACFIKELLIECKKYNIHTAIETNLYASWNIYEKLIPHLNLFMIDLKIFNEEQHKKYTGVSNKQIFDNLLKLDKYNIPIIARTPDIKGINDTEEEIFNICSFLHKLKNIKYYELLPYHPLGIPKAKSLRLKNSVIFETPDKQKIEKLNNIIKQFKLYKCV
jgi:pyruvate formate lyase activating enzyme